MGPDIAMLYGDLEEDAFMGQSIGFGKWGKEAVYRLKERLYGLKQAP